MALNTLFPCLQLNQIYQNTCCSRRESVWPRTPCGSDRWQGHDRNASPIRCSTVVPAWFESLFSKIRQYIFKSLGSICFIERLFCGGGGSFAWIKTLFWNSSGSTEHRIFCAVQAESDCICVIWLLPCQHQNIWTRIFRSDVTVLVRFFPSRDRKWKQITNSIKQTRACVRTCSWIFFCVGKIYVFLLACHSFQWRLARIGYHVTLRCSPSLCLTEGWQNFCFLLQNLPANVQHCRNTHTSERPAIAQGKRSFCVVSFCQRYFGAFTLSLFLSLSHTHTHTHTHRHLPALTYRTSNLKLAFLSNSDSVMCPTHCTVRYSGCCERAHVCAFFVCERAGTCVLGEIPEVCEWCPCGACVSVLANVSPKWTSSEKNSSLCWQKYDNWTKQWRTNILEKLWYWLGLGQLYAQQHTECFRRNFVSKTGPYLCR